jgi:lipopolysaccharide export system permease protein
MARSAPLGYIIGERAAAPCVDPRVWPGGPSQESNRVQRTNRGVLLITIYRHMLGRLAATTAAIMSVIVAEQLLEKSQALCNLVIAGALPLDRLLLIWLYFMPVIFYHATPEIVSIAVAWRYHRWIENFEILTLRCAGRSSCQIACPGIVAAVLAASFCSFNSLCLLPLSWRSLEELHSTALANPGLFALQPGYQQEIAPGLSIGFVGRGRDGTTLKNVVVLDSRNSHSVTEIWARRGRLLRSDEDWSVRFEAGAYSVRTAGGTTEVGFGTLSLPLGRGTPPARPRGFYEESITRLLNPPSEVRKDVRASARWQAEGNRRIINPLLCVGNVVLVLGLLVPRRERNTRLKTLFAIAVASALATNFLPDPIVSIAVRDSEFMPLLYLLPVVPMLAGWLLLAGSDVGYSLFPGVCGSPTQRSSRIVA